MNSVNDREIVVFNRREDVLEPEKVFERGLMEFCYRTRLGLLLSRLLLKRRLVSRLYGWWAKTALSRRKIASFVHRNGIDTSELASPLDSFTSYNDFFIRKLKPGSREVDMQSGTLITPADSRMLAYYLDRDTVVPVKGISYTISGLLGTDKFDSQYENGTCLVFRLAPADYHRFGYIDYGEQGNVWATGKALHSVHPLALDSGLPVFAENYREAVVLNTNNFGQVIHVDVGAMIVGRIVQHQRGSYRFGKGEEKGYFEFGGSTIVLLFRPGTVDIHEDILEYSGRGIETLVSYGEAIGNKK